MEIIYEPEFAMTTSTWCSRRFYLIFFLFIIEKNRFPIGFGLSRTHTHTQSLKIEKFAHTNSCVRLCSLNIC